MNCIMFICSCDSIMRKTKENAIKHYSQRGHTKWGDTKKNLLILRTKILGLPR